MKRLLFLSLLILFTASCSHTDVSTLVDPNIGSVAQLLTTKNPTVHRPHGMIRVFPVTEQGLNDRYLSDKIYGFSVNMPAYRNSPVTRLMPTKGAISFNPRENAAVYDHAFEEVHPWYHKVILEDKDITCDWTTTERAVIYRFIASGDSTFNIIISANGNSHLETDSTNAVSGWEEFENTKQYFHAEFSEPFEKHILNVNGRTYGANDEADGKRSAAGFTFLNSGKPLEIRIGISYIDESQAGENLHKELNDRSFDDVKEESHRIWKEALERIYVEGGTEKEKRIFYTSLYRALERMVDISEYGRYYSSYDGRIHEDKGRSFYVDDWLWDTFRSQHPLLSILEPEKQGDMVESYVRMYEQSGWMPGFPQFYGDFPAMIGFHSAALVWDSWQKGIRNFDIAKAYEGLRKNAISATMLPWRTGPMCELDSFYIEHGWYPALPEGAEETVKLVDGFEKRQSVSVTLEHSYDDWCLAQLARELGKNEDYKYFLKRSQNYRNLFNPVTKFMSPKLADGSWVEPFDPQLSGGVGGRMYFTENNAYIWNFNVMHDVQGLIELMGGKEQFVKKLDELFNTPTKISKWQFMGQFPDASGLNGMFPAGNEPSFHVPYLYNYAGMPWKTQRRIRELMGMWFDDDPSGLPGDEDGGALCSWYVFSAMGFYPVTPGTGLYAIGSPFFRNIKIKLPDGKTFRIKAVDCSEKNKYIRSARLNGNELNRCWLTHSEIMNGGTLVLQMDEKPNKNWAIDPSFAMEIMH
jgi:predicted alpha-1,2-mannosidase